MANEEAEDPPYRLPMAGLGQLVKSLLPDPESALRLRLLRCQVEEAERRRVCVALPHPPEAWVADAPSVVVVGRKGSGKTAVAAAYADGLAVAHGLPVWAIDWRRVPQGWSSVTARKALASARDCVIVVDEAVLRVPKQADATWEAMALARQRGTVWVWTTQALTGLDVDVLRQGVVRWWLPGESTFERDELREEGAEVRRVLRRLGGDRPGFTGQAEDGVVRVTQWPLPIWWTAESSKLWR